MFDPEVAQRLAKLTDALCAEIPGFREIMEEATEDDIMSTMSQLNAFLVANPQYAKRVEELTTEAFEEAPEPQLPTPVDTEHYPIEIDAEHVIVQPPGARQPMLNPLLQANIAERIQFDGDAPELRHGNLPEDATPAVPVDTTARNPVALGWMLESASEEVANEIRQLEAEHEQRLLDNQDQINTQEKQLPAGWEPKDLMVPDPQGYQKGQLPALRKATTPEGSELAQLSPEQRATLAYKALSTTQGRRSAVKTIRELISKGLEGEGFTIEVNTARPAPVEYVPIYAEWTASISGGSNQSAFSFIDTAAKVLGNRLAEQLERIEIDDPVLEVMTINTVDIRQVGWGARIVSRYY